MSTLLCALGLNADPAGAQFGESTAQPLGTSDLMVVLDGWLDNRKELLALTGGGTDNPEQPPDAELLLAAYRRWGIHCVQHLIGDYAFVLWDARKRCLLAARDPMGLRTLFYRQVGYSLLVATDLSALIRPNLPTVTLSAEYLMSYFRENGIVDTPTTPWNGLYRLPKGCLLLAEHGIVRTSRFWDLRSAPAVRYRHEADYLEDFHERFREAVRCRLRSTIPVAIFLSGGLDSTSVFAMAKRLSANPADVFPVSAYYDEFHDSDEREFIRATLDRYEPDPCMVSGDGSWTFRDLDRVPVMDEPWVNLASYHLQVTLHRAALSRGARVALTGYGGDQVLSGSLDRLGGYARRLRLLPLIRHISVLAGTQRLPYGLIWRDFIRDPLRGKRAGSGEDWSWLAAPWRSQLLEPPNDTSLSDLDPAQAVRYTVINKALAVLAIGPAVSRPLGLELRHPFLDRRLVEFLYGIPDELRLDEKLTQKAILRKALHAVLPTKIATRPGKTMSHSAIFQGIQREWRDVGEPILERSRLAELGLADSNGLRNALQKFRMGSEYTETVWLAITLEAWLRRSDTGRILSASPVH
jgi:asparagine synthase (glutamine-hydrolysing)